MRSLALLLSLVVATASVASAADGVTARPVVDFLDSIGANSAIAVRGESLPRTIACARYLGLRWFRSGYESGLPLKDLLELHRQTGARFSYGLGSGGTDIPRLLEGARELAAAGALLAFEGPNEPNNWGVTYQGEAGGGNAPSWLAVAKLQRDLYAAVKADPALKAYPVWSITENGAERDDVGLQFLTIPSGAGALMPDGTRFADFANCHNYIGHPSWPGLHDNECWIVADPGPGCRVDGLFGNYGQTWAKHFAGYPEAELERLPRVTTETGRTITEDTDEDQQACLFLDFYLAQFARGWSFTAIYLMRDRSDEGGNQRFGFYGPDYRMRKSAAWLHDLTTILVDQGRIDHPSELAYSIAKQPTTVHDLLLQRHDGRFVLVLWDERFAPAGHDEVTVDFGKKTGVAVFDPTIGTDAITTLADAASLTLTLSDHPVVIELR